MRSGPASSTCHVVQRDGTFAGSGPFSLGTYPSPFAAYTMASPVQPLRLRCHLTRHWFPTPSPRRTGHWRGEPREASLGHPFVPFRASPYLTTYACPPWVTPVYPGLRWLSPTGCRLLGTLPQHARHLGLIPPFGRKNGSAPRSQALLPPASRRNESPTSGNPVRWVVGKGLPGVIIPNVDLVTRSGAGSRPYHNGTWNEGAARRPQRIDRVRIQIERLVVVLGGSIKVASVTQRRELGWSADATHSKAIHRYCPSQDAPSRRA